MASSQGCRQTIELKHQGYTKSGLDCIPTVSKPDLGTSCILKPYLHDNLVHCTGGALADQGLADQAAYVGGKTVGHHNVPKNYDHEAPHLPSQDELSSGGGSRSGGGQSGGQSGSQSGGQSITQVALPSVHARAGLLYGV